MPCGPHLLSLVFRQSLNCHGTTIKSEHLLLPSRLHMRCWPLVPSVLSVAVHPISPAITAGPTATRVARHQLCVLPTTLQMSGATCSAPHGAASASRGSRLMWVVYMSNVISTLVNIPPKSTQSIPTGKTRPRHISQTLPIVDCCIQPLVSLAMSLERLKPQAET
jgi:hypothetical protein